MPGHPPEDDHDMGRWEALTHSLMTVVPLADEIPDRGR